MLRLPRLAVGGLLAARVLALIACGGMAAMVGARLGLLPGRLSDRNLRMAVMVLVAILGVKHLVG